MTLRAQPALAYGGLALPSAALSPYFQGRLHLRPPTVSRFAGGLPSMGLPYPYARTDPKINPNREAQLSCRAPPAHRVGDNFVGWI